MIVGAIDIGTNTVLLLIAELRDGALAPIADFATITRLGEGVDRARRLLPEASSRTLQALGEYARELERRRVTRVGAVGTSALRDAEGGAEFLDAAERLLGTRPRVIAGSEEAELTFHGALSGLSLEGPVTVFDVGGGSTEIIVGSAGRAPVLEAAVSLDVGSVRLLERYVQSDPPARAELEAAVAAVDHALASAPRPGASHRLVGVAGTVTTLAAIDLELSEYDAARVHGYVLTRAAVDALAARLATITVAERRALAGLEPKRADVIVIGAAIVARVMAWAGADNLVVSDRGVRWGLAEALVRTRAA